MALQYYLTSLGLFFTCFLISQSEISIEWFCSQLRSLIRFWSRKTNEVREADKVEEAVEAVERAKVMLSLMMTLIKKPGLQILVMLTPTMYLMKVKMKILQPIGRLCSSETRSLVTTKNMLQVKEEVDLLCSQLERAALTNNQTTSKMQIIPT